MRKELQQMVREYVAEARGNPAWAVRREVLDELEQSASADFRGGYVTTTSPVAPITWMAKTKLLAADDETEFTPIEMGEPIEIVGVHAVVLGLEAGKVVLGPESLEVAVETVEGTGRRFTASKRQDGARRDATVCTLSSLDAQVANRLLAWKLGVEDPRLSFKVRWAIDDAATRAALNLSNVLVSLNLFVRPLKA